MVTLQQRLIRVTDKANRVQNAVRQTLQGIAIGAVSVVWDVLVWRTSEDTYRVGTTRTLNVANESAASQGWLLLDDAVRAVCEQTEW